jgi:hypothetical protein
MELRTFALIVLLAAMGFGTFQIFVLKERQQELAIENSRLSGISQAHEKILSKHETTIEETHGRISTAEEALSRIGADIQDHEDQLLQVSKTLEAQGRDVGYLKRKVKSLEESPVGSVSYDVNEVMVQTAEEEERQKHAAFSNWTQNHPGWKERSLCMKKLIARNPELGLTEAFNNCDPATIEEL